MPVSRPFKLELPSGRILHGLVDLPAAPGPRPAVVVCHGFKGFMEWGFFPHLGHLLSARGFTAVRFNFSGGGMRPGEDLVGDPEAFAHATPAEDVREIEAVLDAVAGGAIAPGRVDPERLALFGHSRGGGTSILAAARRPALAALVTWSAVATFDRLSEEEKEGWRLADRVPIVNARTGQELELDLSVLEDLEARAAEYDIEAAAAERRAPWLIVHGEADETVPVAEARALADAARAPSRLELVPGGSHTFDAVHPFAGPTPALIQALNLTQGWLRRHLA
jgi:pimeloyl-ACP methyl ester carboxylesterase